LKVPGGYASPEPAYERGIYFGADASLEVQNLVLNNKFSLEYYVRPNSTGGLLDVFDMLTVIFEFYIYTRSPGTDIQVG
jgi:hypothetical protein